MTENEEQSDPMAVVDIALTFTAPIISVRNSLLGAGMGHEQVEHIVTDFAHFLLTTMTFQAMGGNTGPH